MTTMSPPSPMDALCRVCHTASPRCLPLFKPLDDPISGKLATLASILSYCSGLEILEAELFLPHHICPDCVSKLRLSLEFKRSVHRMDRILRQSHADFCRSKKISAVNTRARLSTEIPEDFVLVLDDQEVTEYPAETIRDEEQLLVVESDEAESRLEAPIVQEERLDIALEQHEDDLCEIVDDPDPEQRRSRLERSEPALQCPVSCLSELEVSNHEIVSHLRQICGKQLARKRTFQYHMRLHGQPKIRQEDNDHCIEECLQVEPVLQAKAGEDVYEIVEKSAQTSATQKTVPSGSRPWKPLNPSLQCKVSWSSQLANNSKPKVINSPSIPLDLWQATKHQQLLQVPYAATWHGHALRLHNLRRVL